MFELLTHAFLIFCAGLFFNFALLPLKLKKNTLFNQSAACLYTGLLLVHVDGFLAECTGVCLHIS